MRELPRSIREAAALLRGRKTSALELAEIALERSHADRHNAWLHWSDEHARAQARAADERLKSGVASLLAGIPWACKDIIGTRAIPTTAGSRILEGYLPPYSATVVERLDAKGAVMVGKTNLDEFAMGSSNENSAFGPVKNPWCAKRVPGGSSGGSAVAVAAGEVLFSLGTDTGGSIRQPAALCGVVGMKPTYGRVPRWGVVAFASSLDQVGPFANTVEDAAIVCEALFGKDPNDATMVDLPADDLRRDLERGVRGMRIGVPKEYFSVKGMEPGVERAVRDALKVLEREGAKLEEVSLSLTDHGLAVYYIIQPAEASSNLARYDGVRYGLRVEGRDLTETYRLTRGRGFGPEVKRRMILGTYALSAGYRDAYYVKAQKVRTLIKDEYDKVFEKVDALVTPTSPTVAFPIGAKVNDPLSMYLNDVFTLPVNISGLPGISIPCGLSEDLPVGLQVIANSYQERTMFRVAAAYERATPHHRERPKEKAA
ncbi:MAG TPA: Asp-tRNA(Asn)/Glu-tRNA(Gln) amidotransferase subunit GatA [Candidatus Limnocylindria bacterium]|nr:Asp-tRNA(Asn)/Glu-tRNA(Gln) amidotransferase subunit GatA [Candidatus Limnocylindria bacterium]